MKMTCALLSLLCSISLFAAEKTIKLPEPDKTGGKPLMETLTERRSSRAFSDKKLDRQTLSTLLYAAYGINRPDGRHTAPTARNVQDMYVYVGLEEGTYVYVPSTHSLELVSEKDLRSQFGRQAHFAAAPVALTYVSDTSKYSTDEDKIFYPANHAGYISQNVYLFCASEGLSTVICAMVDKEELGKALGLSKDMKVLLSQPVGYPPAE